MIHKTRQWDQRTCHLSLSTTLMRFCVSNHGTSHQQGFGFDFDVDKTIMNKELYSLIQMFVVGRSVWFPPMSFGAYFLLVIGGGMVCEVGDNNQIFPFSCGAMTLSCNSGSAYP
jgi:hypothetical protein